MPVRTWSGCAAGVAFWLAGALAPAVYAQEPSAQDKKYEALEKRVRELEASAKEKDAGEEKEPGASWYGRLKILGFCDATYIYRDRARGHLDGDDSSSFGVGQFDLFLTAQLSEKFSFLGELVFESNTENELAVDLERILISYRFCDEFTLSAGRYHTALGYWNQTYHHGAMLFASVGRPEFYEFEDAGGVLPVHSVGLEARGRLEVPLGALEYTANLSNGRGRSADEIQKAVDYNTSKGVGLNVGFRPDAIPGLFVGGSGFWDEIPSDSGTPGREEDVIETIFGGYVVYQRGPVQVMAEYFRMLHHGSQDQPDYDFDMFYAQVAYEAGSWKPYYRYEDVRGPRRDLDPFFGDTVTSYSTHLAGIGYRFTSLTVVKVEIGFKNGIDRLADETYVAVQIAFGF